MNSSIVLLDLVSGNVLSDFASESEAWTALREMAEDDGLEALADLSLMRIAHGQPTVIAMDDALVRRVTHAVVKTRLAQ